jgi:hypothetical protein
MPTWTPEELRDYENRARTRLPDTQPCQLQETLEANSGGETQGARLPHVCFTLCRKQLLDVDAKYASVKDLLDGLAISRIICGDKEGQITLEVNQEKVGKGQAEKTIIEITP